MRWKVLGPGCANCRKLEEIAREAVAQLGGGKDRPTSRPFWPMTFSRRRARDQRQAGVVGAHPEPASVAEWIREAGG
jgi:hypothetical protein